MSSHDSSHDEDEFEFAEQFSNKPDASGAARAGGSAGKAQAKPQRVSDQHFDEAMDVSDGSVDESVASPTASPGPKTTSTKPTSAGKSQSQPQTKSFGSDDDEGTDDESPKAAAKPTSAASKPGATKSGPTSAAAGAGAIAAASKSAAGKPAAQDYAGGASESESESEEEEDTSAPRQTSQAKMYNPADYKHLQVSHEIQDLFDYIGRFQPQDIVLDTKMKPFIPDYIPAVGEIDAFIKIPSPDGKRDDLGLTVLDEPAAQQSDPTVLDLRLRVTSKQSNANVPMTVRSIEHADKNPKKITTWINNIDEVHRQKPPPNVVYTRAMPDIESLMQAWPTQFEQALKDIPLPSASLDLDVVQFSRIVCAVMDIPVYDKLTESLHVLFTLYSEFKNNSHFAQE